MKLMNSTVVYLQQIRCYARQPSTSIFGSLNDFWKRPINKSINYEIVKPGDVSDYRQVPVHIKRPDYADTENPAASPVEECAGSNDDRRIKGVRQAGIIARKILDLARHHINVGITTDELDDKLHRAIVDFGAYPSPLLYRGFPKSICTSVNNVACHGIPDDRPLQDGDIINVDVTVYHNNYHGDCSETFLVGNVDVAGRKLVATAKKCRDEAIKICKPRQRFSAIGKKISSIAKKEGFQVMPLFCGHGIGTYFHGPPQIYHFDNNLKGLMEEGMTFTIEPVISEGTSEVVILEDGWTAVSIDNSRSAQFEHTILITSTGAQVLTEL